MPTDTYTEAQLIAMGAKPASTDSMTQTQAVSIKTPGVIVPGAVTGSTPGGQGIAPVPTQIQAITGNNGSAEAQAFLELQKKREMDAAQAAGNMAKSSAGASVAAYTDSNGVYHPATTTVAPQSPASAAPTAGQIYSGLGEDPALAAAYDAQGKLIQDTQAPIDEAAIRANTVAKFQKEIDALDRYYASVKADRIAAETRLNQGRLGVDTAVQARRGLIGSDFGNAATDTINTKSEEIKSAIGQSVDAEKNAQIQSLLRQASVAADSEIAAKQAAKMKGAQDYIDFLKGAAQRKDDRANTAIAALIASGQEADDGTLKTLANTLGMDVSALKAKLTDAKQAAETAAAKAAKESTPELKVIDGIGYERQADGTYKAVTPGKAPEQEKPLVVGGVAYQKQADGSYKAITPTVAPKALTRTVGKVLYTSLDNGVTWAPAQGVKATVPVARTGGGGSSTPQQDVYEGIAADIAAIMGSDGKVDTAKFPQLRQHVAVTQPKLLAWFDKTYPMKQVLNPDDPTAAQLLGK